MVNNIRRTIKITINKTIKKLRSYSDNATTEENRNDLSKIADKLEEIIDNLGDDTNE